MMVPFTQACCFSESKESPQKNKARETETKHRGQKIELKAEASDFCLEESFKSSLLHVVLIGANKLSTTAEGVVLLKRLEAKLTNACDFSTP